MTASLPGLNAKLVDGWLRRCARNAQEKLACFYSIERSAKDVLHIHALIAGTGRLTISQLQGDWTTGHGRITRYNPYRGAAWYVAKDVWDDSAWWDISRFLPPLRTGEGMQDTNGL